MAQDIAWDRFFDFISADEIADEQVDEELRRLGFDVKRASLRAAAVTHMCHCSGTPDPLAPSAAKPQPQPQPKAGDKVVLLRSGSWVDVGGSRITIPAGTVLDVVSLPDDLDSSLYINFVPFRCDMAQDGWLVTPISHVQLCLVEIAESVTHDCHCSIAILLAEGCKCGGA